MVHGFHVWFASPCPCCHWSTTLCSGNSNDTWCTAVGRHDLLCWFGRSWNCFSRLATSRWYHKYSQGGSPQFFLQQCYECVVVIACQRGTWGQGQSLRISSYCPVSNFTMSALELGHKIMKTNYWAGVDGTINLEKIQGMKWQSMPMPWSWLQVTSPDTGDRDIADACGKFITRLHLGEFMQFTLTD